MTGFGRAIRHEWLLEEGMTFLNHGSFGATPRRVLAAQQRLRTAMERQPLRFFLNELGPGLRAAAADLAGLLGARGADLAFVENATSGVNAVLRSFPLGAGDQVLTTGHAYPAVDAAITYVCGKHGAEVVRVPVPFPSAGPDEALDAIASAIGPRTRLAVIDHITSATALVLPVTEIVRACHARGVPILVDGAHGPGMLDLDLPAIGADWYTGNAHKWLNAAKGCAMLWANPESEIARTHLHPAVISLVYPDGFPDEFDWVGTRDPTAWLSVGEALAFFSELGPERVRAHNHELVLEGARLVGERWGVDPAVQPSMTGSMVTLPCPVPVEPVKEATEELRLQIWREHRIETTPVPHDGRAWLRLSAQVYNDMDDYRRLAEALRP